MTKIEWTRGADGSSGRTWNPTLGCSVASPGCDNCYAATLAHRGLSEAHRGLTVLGPGGVEWTGEVRTHPERLDVPLRVEIDRRADTYERWRAAGLPLSSDLFGLAVESVARDITGRTRFVPRQRKATP